MQSHLTPNRDAILSHLKFLFADCREYQDGRIEIAYTPPDSRAVNNAEWFDILDLDAAADFAAKINAREGVNVYVGAAIRNPDTPPFGRSNALDFYASTVIWCDLDDAGAAQAAKARYAALPPSFVVVTGRAPDLRAQVWWKLMHPETDPEALRANLAHVCAALDGDSSVVDHSRVMRLGGSIAWPKKDGRVLELTEIKTPEKPTLMVMSERFKSYFPGVDPLLKNPTSGGVGHDGKPRNPFTGKLKYQELLERTLTPGQWHYNMRDAVASMISSGWSDEQVRLACAAYCDNGAHDPDLSVLIATARKKWDKPDPETNAQPDQYDAQTGEIIPFKAIDIADIDLDHIPPRAWLFGDIVARKYVSMIAASPGAGKSVFTMQMGVCASAGKTFGPYKPHEKTIKTWVYNNEEGDEELRRRVAAMLKHEGITKAEIAGKFFLNSGEQQSICIARKKLEGGGVLHTPDYDNLKAQILAKKIDLLVVDPFAETHDVNENSNDEIKTVAALYRKIAIDCNCAVLLVHHTRKGSNSADKSNEQNSNADSARGGGAQIGVVRRMFTLAKMDTATAAKMDVPDNQRYWYVRFDDAKTNITAPSQDAQWFKFESIALNNGTGIYAEGDKVGVLAHKTEDEIRKEGTDKMKADRGILMSRIASIMINAGLDEISLSHLLDLLKQSGYVKYKERALRKFIEETLCYKHQNQPVIAQGFRCVMKYVEGKNKKEGHRITLQKEVVYD